MRSKASFVLAASTCLLLAIAAWLISSPSIAEEMTPRAYLPYTSKGESLPAPTPTPTPPPQPLGLRVYDMYGSEQTYEWAVQKYGVRVEQIGGEAYHCVELRERSGPASVDVWVYDANGQPAVGVPVEFHWPSGMDLKYTEPNGKAGFAYGPGSWITDPEVGGPHWLIVLNESSCDLVSRLGMLAGTPHDHLDVTYRYGILGEQSFSEPYPLFRDTEKSGLAPRHRRTEDYR
jgi:hypothetical protein